MARNSGRGDSVAEAEQRRVLRAQMERAVFGEDYEPSDGTLVGEEFWWRDHYDWLKAKGYVLRPRYSPSWVPSWQKTNASWSDCEDGRAYPWPYINDATRTSDGKYVMLKRICKSIHPYEVDIGRYFSSDQMKSEPANHCVPLYDVFSVDDDDDFVMIVMPLLRGYNNPDFDTFGEVVECFRQIFEGLQFMHRHHVAHRDCMTLNIMMDADRLYPESFHPRSPELKRDFSGYAKYYTRTQRPSKYYLIDFGLSRRYDPSDTDPREDPIWGGDKEVPEFQNSDEPRNPFHTDIFYIGNLIRQDFIQVKPGFDFMIPLVNDMIQVDPSKRPTMDEVVSRFDEIRRSLSSWKLRSRVVHEDEDKYLRAFRTVTHWTRRIGFVVRRVPAIPRPSP